MAAQERSPQKPDIENGFNSPEDFIRTLHQQIFEWLTKTKRGIIVEELGPQRVGHWDSHLFAPGRSVSLAIEIERAVLIATPKYDFALVLGKRLRSRYDHEETLGVQFGVLPKLHGKFFETLDTVRKIRNIVNQESVSPGCTEFNIDPFGKIECDAWADDGRFGGQNFQSWEKQRQLTPKGLTACLEVVQRTTRNAFL